MCCVSCFQGGSALRSVSFVVCLEANKKAKLYIIDDETKQGLSLSLSLFFSHFCFNLFPYLVFVVAFFAY